MPRDDDELLAELGEALAPEERQPDAARVAQVRAAAEAAAAGRVHPAGVGSPARRPPRRLVPILAAAAVVGIVVAAAIGVVSSLDGNDGTERAAAVVEFETVLRNPDGRAVADVTGLRAGIGRIVELRTDTLPILPTGEFYEVWFVGAGDAPDAPNRISAGTFHPDEQGHTDIVLTAAVDPAKYPELVVTAEPGDGDPRPSGLEVLRAPIEVTG